MNTSKRVLIKLNKEEKNGIIFDVKSLINDSGYINPSSVESEFPNNGQIFVTNLVENEYFQPYLKDIRKHFLFEAKVEEEKIMIHQKRGINTFKTNTFKINEQGSFKKVRYLYNTKWISEKENLFYSISNKKIPQEIRNAEHFIPVDLSKNLVYDEVKISNEGLSPLEGNEIKEYKVDQNLIDNCIMRLDRSICCATEDGIKKINKNKEENRTLDLMGEEGLKEWLRDILLLTASKKDVENLLCNLQNKNNIDDDVFKNRLDRCKKIFVHSVLSPGDLDFFQDKWKEDLKKQKEEILNDVRSNFEKKFEIEKEKRMSSLENELSIYKDKSISKIVEEQKKELQCIENELNQKKNNLKMLEQSFKEKNSELSELNANIKKLSVEKVSIETSKNIILSSLEDSRKIILSNLQEYLVSNNQKPKEQYMNIEKHFACREEASDVDEDELSSLITNKFDYEIKKILVIPLSYKISVIPNISYAYALAHFSGNCWLKIITVEHEWYHLGNFEKAGLIEFWNRAFQDKESNYLLVLQNINMIPICSALQSLIDLINGRGICLAGAIQNGFPDNLRICCTILPSVSDKDIGLQLDTNYKSFKFVGDPSDNLPVSIFDIMEQTQKRKVMFSDIKIKSIDKNEVNPDFDKYSNY